jgi:membrane protease YdiL (CAAX protease family)
MSLLVIAGFIGIGITYGITRMLHFDHHARTFGDPRKAALWALTIVLIGYVLQVAPAFISFPEPREYIPKASREYTMNKISNYIAFAFLSVGPVLVAICLRRESLASTGVSTHNLGNAVAVGMLLAFFIIAAQLLLIHFGDNRSLMEIVCGLTVRHFWALIYYVVVSFAEEFVFRGYLQSRLIAWLGRWQGWVIASILMALIHIGNYMMRPDVSLLNALISTTETLPFSLFMGYVMLRTENLIAPVLAHTFLNWVGTLG